MTSGVMLDRVAAVRADRRGGGEAAASGREKVADRGKQRRRPRPPGPAPNSGSLTSRSLTAHAPEQRGRADDGDLALDRRQIERDLADDRILPGQLLLVAARAAAARRRCRAASGGRCRARRSAAPARSTPAMNFHCRQAKLIASRRSKPPASLFSAGARSKSSLRSRFEPLQHPCARLSPPTPERLVNPRPHGASFPIAQRQRRAAP